MASIDKLKLLRGNDIPIDDVITLHQPSINDITDSNELDFYNTFYTLCSIPSDMKSVLWDSGVDFMKISDWQLFIMLSRNFDANSTKLILGDIDLANMQIMKVSGTDQIVLADEKRVITEECYLSFIPYIREMIGYVLKREKAGNKFTKQIMIDEDRKKRSESHKDFTSMLEPIIISLVNTEEFSYTYETAYDLTIYQLMRSYYQIQNKKAACALYQGSMSGFVDTSKINKDSFSWIYDEAKFKN